MKQILFLLLLTTNTYAQYYYGVYQGKKYLTIYAEPDYLLINPYGTDDLSFSSQWTINSMSVVTQMNKGNWNFGDKRETFSLR